MTTTVQGTIQPARFKPGVTVAQLPAPGGEGGSQPGAANIRGTALIFWDPRKPGRKLDAIDTDQITPAQDCVSESLDSLVEAGYQPEVAYYEVMHELKLIVDLLHEGGLRKMHKFISDTAAYGDMVSGPRVVDANSRKQMKAVLNDIQDGTFARNWIAENEAGMPEFKRMMKVDLEHPIEKVGAELRGRMDWLEE